MSKDKPGYYYERGRVPETPLPGEEPESWGEKTAVIGQKKPRVDGYDRVSGSAVYPSDLLLPGMLHAAVLRCPHPHAKVKSVNAKKARSMPGVRAVLTRNDSESRVKWRYTNDSQWGDLFEAICRFEGEPVAAAAAETPYQAWDAVKAIEVEYEVLPFVSDERRALDDDAPKVWPDGNRVRPDQEYGRGNLDQAFAEADATVEMDFRTACEMHTPLELHGAVAKWDGDSLTIWESTQGVYSIQSTVAEVLNLPHSKVRVIGRYMGGGFGSKLFPSKYTVISAILAKMTGRPVRLFLTREETFLAMGNRPAANMKMRAAAKKDGTLTGLSLETLASYGAYPGHGTQLVDFQVKDLYLCPSTAARNVDVFMNAGPARPFRAPGHPQCSWALEQVIDILSEKIGMDPVEFRLKNIPQVSQARGDKPYTVTGLKECLVKGAEAFGWEKAKKDADKFNAENDRVKRGVGAAACLWIVGDGGPPSTVVVKLFSDGSVNLNMGASDIGTGTKTIMALVVAEELGVTPDLIQIENADTGTTQYATPSGGSKTVPTEAPTVRNACIEVKRQLLDMAGEQMESRIENLRFQGETIVDEVDGKSVGVTSLNKLNKRGVVMGVGYRGANPGDKIVNPFGAQFCEVEVDMETGEARILRFLGAHDSGRVMDRLTYDSQVYGGVIMGVGLGATEFRVLDVGGTGKLLNKNWHDYKLPTALDAPAETVSTPIEIPDFEANNTGAKGLGEPVTIPTAAALANAVYHASGVRLTESPINPLSLAPALARQQMKGS